MTFPIDCFPPTLRAYMENVATVYGVPIELPTVSVMAAVASMFRKRIYSHDRHLNYPQLWVIIVARSGVGKTKPLHAAFEPVEEADRRSWEIYRREKEDYELKIAMAKKASKKEERLVPPVYKHRLVSDATPEALLKSIHDNDGITVYRDKLARWFNDFGRYNKSGEVQNDLTNTRIDVPLMEKGIKLCRYFISCGEKVFDLIQGRESQTELSNEQILRLLRKVYDQKSIGTGSCPRYFAAGRIQDIQQRNKVEENVIRYRSD